MAAGEDGLELSSRVQLLDGPFYEGQYLIGSVNFVRSASPAGPSSAEGNPKTSILRSSKLLIFSLPSLANCCHPWQVWKMNASVPRMQAVSDEQAASDQRLGQRSKATAKD